MTGQVFELPPTSGIRKFWEELIKEKAQVFELDPENGLERNDDVYSCGNCAVTDFSIRRDGTITCWGCGEAMHIRWFRPDDDDPEREVA
jgi:hypothetical protein